MKSNPNEENIIIKDNVKGNNVELKYKFNEPQKRLTRYINSKVKLVAEWFGEGESFIYVVADGKSHCLESNFKNKKMSRAEYMENGRLDIFSFVTIAQILRMKKDLVEIFENKKEFKTEG